MLIAGFVMHRIKEIDPWQHAQRMIAALAHSSRMPDLFPDDLVALSLSLADRLVSIVY